MSNWSEPQSEHDLSEIFQRYELPPDEPYVEECVDPDEEEARA